MDKPRSTLTDVITALLEVDELEGESHSIWDDSFGNLAHGNLTREMRDAYCEKTYTATRKHREAMELLREAIRKLQSLR